MSWASCPESAGPSYRRNSPRRPVARQRAPGERRDGDQFQGGDAALRVRCRRISPDLEAGRRTHRRYAASAHRPPPRAGPDPDHRIRGRKQLRLSRHSDANAREPSRGHQARDAGSRAQPPTDQPPRAKDFEEHPVIFLFVYDAWVELWGQEFADPQVVVESRRQGRYDYAGAWKDALALGKSGRAEAWAKFRATYQG